MVEPEKRMERIKKHRDGGKNYPKRWERGKGIQVLYQQPERGYQFVWQGSTGTLVGREYALAAGCDIP